MGLLGERVSGAVLFNGKPIKENKYKTIFKRNNI
jgi:uncharacterized GH25 family protein